MLRLKIMKRDKILFPILQQGWVVNNYYWHHGLIIGIEGKIGELTDIDGKLMEILIRYYRPHMKIIIIKTRVRNKFKPLDKLY